MIERRASDWLNDADREDFALVKDAAYKMRQLITDLLEYSRVTDQGVSFATIPLGEACSTAITNLGDTIRQSGASIEVGTLPTVTGNRIQLIQLFQNLISNAIKFQKPGIAPRIAVTATHADDGWVISVRDNGIGIPTTDQDIFEIFRRLHPGGGYSGSGVGLAICRRIVQHHNGHIWYESTPDQGSTFHFSLPERHDA
jgi:signal transduction histidine kinase